MTDAIPLPDGVWGITPTYGARPSFLHSANSATAMREVVRLYRIGLNVFNRGRGRRRPRRHLKET
jgi:hypothetical protein